MNNPDDSPFFPFQLVQNMNVRICVSLKIHFMQRIVHLFGPERLGEVMSSPNPVILPLINYHMSLDVHIFILF